MALPFRVWDYEFTFINSLLTRDMYCIRCEAWIPRSGFYGVGIDPHTEDHLNAWQAMRQVERKQLDIYAKHLSEKAIDDSIEFYSTESGQEIINKIPKIHEEVDEVLFQFHHTLQAEIDSIEEDI